MASDSRPPRQHGRHSAEDGFTFIELVLALTMTTVLLAGMSAAIFVMLTVGNDSQAIADVAAERSIARAHVLEDFASVSSENILNGAASSPIWINRQPTSNPPNATYPNPISPNMTALQNDLVALDYAANWSAVIPPALVSRDLADDPAQVADMSQTLRFRCPDETEIPLQGGNEPVIPLFLLWSKTWIGDTTDVLGNPVSLHMPVSTQIVYKLVRIPQTDTTDPSEPRRCDLVRDVHYFPAAEDLAGTLIAELPPQSDIVARYVASVDPTQGNPAPAVHSALKEIRCDEFDPDGAGGPLPPINITDLNYDCHWRWQITLQLHTPTALKVDPIRLVVDQKARTRVV